MNPPKKTTPSKGRQTKAQTPPPLKESAAHAIDHYLITLDGETCTNLYDTVIQQVEGPLFAAVLRYTEDNQSQAASLLGLNRGTLRKKLREHGLLAASETAAQKQPKKSARTGKTRSAPAAGNHPRSSGQASKRKR